MHDLFGIKKKLRSSVDGIFFRSLPTNKYDISVAKDYLGEDKFNEFADIIKRRDKEPKLKAITYYNIRGEVGRLEWDLAKNNHIFDMDTRKDILSQFGSSHITLSQFITTFGIFMFGLIAMAYLIWVYFSLRVGD